MKEMKDIWVIVDSELKFDKHTVMFPFNLSSINLYIIYYPDG